MTFSKGQRINTLHGSEHSSHGNEALLLVNSLRRSPPQCIYQSLHPSPHPHLPSRQDQIAEISVLHSSSALSRSSSLWGPICLLSHRSFPLTISLFFISIPCFYCRGSLAEVQQGRGVRRAERDLWMVWESCSDLRPTESL